MRISLRELFLITVIAALVILVWQLTHHPTFASSGLATALHVKLQKAMESRGIVMAAQTGRTAADRNCWTMNYEVKSANDRITNRAMWNEAITIIHSELGARRCEIQFGEGLGSGSMDLYYGFRWAGGNGFVQASLTPLDANTTSLRCIVYEHPR
jgi:hypothetical protein